MNEQELAIHVVDSWSLGDLISFATEVLEERYLECPDLFKHDLELEAELDSEGGE